LGKCEEGRAWRAARSKEATGRAAGTVVAAVAWRAAGGLGGRRKEEGGRRRKEEGGRLALLSIIKH
jgi:hypothetical protein